MAVMSFKGIVPAGCRWDKVILLVSALLILLSGCSSRTVIEKNGQQNYLWESSFQHEDRGLAISAATESERYLVFHVAQSKRAHQLVEDGVTRKHWSGPNTLDECVELSLGSLGMLWVIDTVVWLVQLGSNDGMCYAQLWGPSTRSYYDYDTRRPSGRYRNYLDEYRGGAPLVRYQGEELGRTRVENGVWIFPKSMIEGPYDLDKTVTDGDAIVLRP